MGSLEAWGVAEGDWTSFWQAVIVDLFSGGSAWWDSSCGAASLQVGIVACGTRGEFQRWYGTSIGPEAAGLLSRLKRPLARCSSPAVYPAEPIVSYRINPQFSGWNRPP